MEHSGEEDDFGGLSPISQGLRRAEDLGGERHRGFRNRGEGRGGARMASGMLRSALSPAFSAESSVFAPFWVGWPPVASAHQGSTALDGA